MAKAKREKQVENSPTKDEQISVDESEIDKSTAPEESLIDQEIDVIDVEEETQTEEGIAPEVDAIHEDNETAKEAEKSLKADKQKSAEKKSAKKSPKVVKKPRVKSKKYQEKAEKIDEKKIYSIPDAIEAVKEISYTKFDGTVSLAIRIEKAKKAQDSIRGTIRLPHGTGKTLKVEIATDDLIEKIKKGETDFDILVASPSYMPKLGQVAKILGPKGKMPNPKDGTVVDDPKAAVGDLAGKVVRYRGDLGNNLHLPVGKVSWEKSKLEENIRVVLKSLARFKLANVTLSATMGPGIRVEGK